MSAAGARVPQRASEAAKGGLGGDDGGGDQRARQQEHQQHRAPLVIVPHILPLQNLFSAARGLSQAVDTFPLARGQPVLPPLFRLVPGQHGCCIATARCKSCHQPARCDMTALSLHIALHLDGALLVHEERV